MLRRVDGDFTPDFLEALDLRQREIVATRDTRSCSQGFLIFWLY